MTSPVSRDRLDAALARVDRFLDSTTVWHGPDLRRADLRTLRDAAAYALLADQELRLLNHQNHQDAERIAALEAEVERLRDMGIHNIYSDTVHDLTVERDALRDRIAALEAEVARLTRMDRDYRVMALEHDAAVTEAAQAIADYNVCDLRLAQTEQRLTDAEATIAKVRKLWESDPSWGDDDWLQVHQVRSILDGENNG